jgi:hypothetical protein
MGGYGMTAVGAKRSLNIVEQARRHLVVRKSRQQERDRMSIERGVNFRRETDIG